MYYSFFLFSYPRKDEISLSILRKESNNYNAMIVPKGSPFREMFNQGLMTLKQSGPLDALSFR